MKLLSAIGLQERPRIVTTDGEFYSLRRQLARLGEVGVDVVRVAARPVDGLAERMAAAITADTAGAFVSAVLFEDSRIVPHLNVVAEACEHHGVPFVIDAYHAIGCMPFPLKALGLESAFVTGAGYKYLQWGEGNGYLRLPPHAQDLRPIVTGWFAEFEDLTGDAARQGVKYPRVRPPSRLPPTT